jgi:transketolase
LCGGYGGLSDAFDGATHHSIEDIALMRTLPGMTVMVASDAQVTDWMVRTAIDVTGPMYIRLSRDAFPACHPENAKFELGKGMAVREGTDCTVIACGLEVSMAVKAAEAMAKKGISVRVIDMFTIKPIDACLIEKCAKDTGCIVTAEEATIIGGLGGAVSEVLAKRGCQVPVEMIGIPDTHCESGSYKDLLRKYGLDSQAIEKAIENAVSRK